MSKAKMSDKPKMDMNAMAIYTVVSTLMATGAQVLQERYGLTVEQTADWAKETMDIANSRLPKGAGNGSAKTAN